MSSLLWSMLIFVLMNFWWFLGGAIGMAVLGRIIYRFRVFGVNYKEIRYIIRRLPFYAMVGFFSFLSVAPFMIMILHTFKQDADLYRRAHPFIFRREPTLEHLQHSNGGTDYLYFLQNSLLVGIVVVLITLAFALPAGYALARLAGRWGERAGVLMFLIYLLPPTLLFIPMFRIVVFLGLKDSLWSLILIYPTITVPFSVWLLQGFFKSIPIELEEAARVDGYNRVESFLRVIMPLSLPGIISTVVFTFTLTLHEFIYGLVFISETKLRTISVGVPTELILGDVYFWQPLLAAAVIVAIPVGLVYNLFLDRLIQGFTMGAVKG
ncbi:MAG UNVERIFIED_CONTAM: carbohydrate ABC transporter permease [Anaerolineae bacterium]